MKIKHALLAGLLCGIMALWGIRVDAAEENGSTAPSAETGTVPAEEVQAETTISEPTAPENQTADTPEPTTETKTDESTATSDETSSPTEDAADTAEATSEPAEETPVKTAPVPADDFKRLTEDEQKKISHDTKELRKLMRQRRGAVK